MINFKTLTKEELKKNYFDNPGFVFQSSVKSSNEAIERLCATLIQNKITQNYPEFITRIDNLTTVFVYKDSFNFPTFFQSAIMAMQMGICKVESIYNYCKI